MIEYNPFSPEVMRDPHPIYKRMREEAPAYHIAEYDAWALSRFQDIWDASGDNARFSAASGTTSAHVLTKVQPVTPMINMMDPPDHTKLRSELRPFFSPAAIRKLEGFIRGLVVECIEAARERGQMDVMSDFASQVAVKVACKVNGIPQEDGDLLNNLVWRFFAREEGIDGMTPDGLKAMEELFGYFIGLLHARRKSGLEADDVVNLLLRTELGGEKLPDEAIASHLTMLIIGGSETFPKVFATAMQRLHEYPDQRADCAKDPSLIPDAFQEVLRYDMPTQFLCRTLLEDFEIHGQKMRKGQPVLFLYPSANRDPREFDDPDTFNVHRKPERILSFGAGTHMCLGINVAKLEGRICLEETLARIPNYTAHIDRAERLVTDFVQGWATLPITF